MYQAIAFLIIALLMINVAPDVSEPLISLDPLVALALSIGVFAFGLLLRRGSLAILFLLGHHYIWLGHRPYADVLPRSLFALLSILAFLAIYARGRYTQPGMWRFLLPFTVPFLLFETLYDILRAVPHEGLHDLLLSNGNGTASLLLYTGITALFLGCLVILMPPLLQRLWGCRPIEESPLKKRLDILCERLGFRHAGLRNWPAMRHGATAAILGIVPRLRYVLFTDRLLKRCPEDQIEAILVHEIGHSRYKHLLWYPWIVFGMTALSGIVALYLVDPLLYWSALHSLYWPSWVWSSFDIALILGSMIGVVLLYFRFAFGFFSRNFERQADLHLFDCGVTPSSLQHALLTVARLNGIDPKVTNWHHYGILERIGCIDEMIADPRKIQGHHRRVRRILGVYSVLLLTLIGWLAAVHTEWEPVAGLSEQAQDQARGWLSRGVRGSIAGELVDRLDLRSEVTAEVIEKMALLDPVPWVPGLLEYYSAQQLALMGERRDARILVAEAIRLTDFDALDPSIQESYEQLSKSLSPD